MLSRAQARPSGCERPIQARRCGRESNPRTAARPKWARATKSNAPRKPKQAPTATLERVSKTAEPISSASARLSGLERPMRAPLRVEVETMGRCCFRAARLTIQAHKQAPAAISNTHVAPRRAPATVSRAPLKPSEARGANFERLAAWASNYSLTMIIEPKLRLICRRSY